jgi:hypothetical protein
MKKVFEAKAEVNEEGTYVECYNTGCTKEAAQVIIVFLVGRFGDDIIDGALDYAQQMVQIAKQRESQMN